LNHLAVPTTMLVRAAMLKLK
jgi:hypothetical protein